MRYIVVVNPGHDREERYNCATWQYAFRKAEKLTSLNPDAVVEVIETDRDGRRTYNMAGEIIGREDN